MCPDCVSCDISIIHFCTYSALLYVSVMERPAEANSNAMPLALPATSGTIRGSQLQVGLMGVHLVKTILSYSDRRHRSAYPFS